MPGKALLGVVAVGPIGAVAVVGAVLAVAGGAVPAEGGSPEARWAGPSSPRAAADIPPGMLELYRAGAATCPGLTWEVLAGIGRLETDHGRDVAVSSAGAEGPMQFLPSTWAAYAVDADGGDVPDINDPADAVFTAARMLCADGAGSPVGVYGAVFAYNHSNRYVSDVLGWAATYAAVYGPRPSSPPD